MAKQYVKDMTTGNELPLLLRFSLPMLVGNIFQQFYRHGRLDRSRELRRDKCSGGSRYDIVAEFSVLCALQWICDRGRSTDVPVFWHEK